MKSHDDELIAMLIDDAKPSVALQRWLDSDRGRRKLAEYQRVLSGLQRLYSNVAGAMAPRAAYYDSITTPIGRVFVATIEGGLVRVSFRRSESAFASDLRQELGTEVMKSASKTKAVVHQIRDYFAGRRTAFDVQTDLSHVTPFQRRVLLATAQIPRGRVVSYGDIAKRIGRPRGSRAVGQALGHNPIPIVIPCHRIIATDGKLGGYTGGLTIKRKLLRLEGALAANA
ncbi:MAG: methylated-DNA--[protein]-cysteine S-methyltransferase [Deltaproteobacteria bacterium]|nr:methylated-DNA--[protein]-cysteine S-methyltransferase [Deltaproteobacteria bacterium]MBI3388036.1 methylated-DNA--[protein]-cysteine S-methyltransferase [Deltaproteobacteria bacterium]